MNEPVEDTEFEAYIGRRSHLSRRYRDLGAECPPKELDDAVLTLARSAHNLKRTQAPAHEVYVGWMAPVAFAATVVLVFTVVLQIVIRPQLMPRSVAEADRHATPAAAALEPLATKRANPQPREAASDKLEQQAAPEHRIASTGSNPQAVGVLDNAKMAAPRPAEIIDAEPRPAPARASTMEGKASEEAAVTDERRDISAQATGSLSVAERTQAVAPSKDASDRDRDPEAWLAEIEQLRRDGKSKAADRQMKLFLEKYPEYFRTHAPTSETR